MGEAVVTVDKGNEDTGQRHWQSHGLVPGADG